MPSERELSVSRALSSVPEVGLFSRGISALGQTPQQRMEILQNFGVNAEISPAGELNVREGDRVGPVNPSGFDMGDVVEFAAEIPQIALSTLGGISGGMAGGGPTAGLGALPGAMLGAATGEAAGQGMRQSLAHLAGAESSPDVGSIVTDLAIAAIMDPIGGFVGKLAKRIGSPFRRSASTDQITDVVSEADRFGMGDVLPPSSKTESPFVGALEARAESSTRTGPQYRKGMREPFREKTSGVFHNIGEKLGAKDVIGESDFIGAAAETLKLREAEVGQLFEQVRELLPSPETIPITTQNTRVALRRTAKRVMALDLPDSDITKSVRAQISSLTEDINGLTNFNQLDAFRKKIGSTLRSAMQMDQFKETGLDVELGDVYGGLAKDVRESIEQGQFAREVGGQTSGQIGKVNPGSVNASQMEAGILSEGELPTPSPIRKNLIARGRRGQPKSPRTSTEILDDLSGRVDKALEALDLANAKFTDLMALERSSVTRLLKNPDRSESMVTAVMRLDPQEIRRFRQKIGAEATDAGAAGSTEGAEAWSDFQTRAFQILREGALDEDAATLKGQTIPIDGKKLRAAIQRLGGKTKLAEIFTEDGVNELYDFSRLLTNADPFKRPFAQLGEEAKKPRQISSGIAALTRLGQAGVDRLATSLGFPKSGAVVKFLTVGLVDENQSRILSNVGRGAAQTLRRGITTEETRTQPSGRIQPSR